MTDDTKPKITIDEMAAFCKRKGLVYPSSEIYGGLTGFFDYGPYGSELKNNIKQEWWKFFVHAREDIVGIDGSIITNPQVWVASGHAAQFSDLILTCKKGDFRERADHYIEQTLKISGDGLTAKQIDELIQKHKLTCPNCKQPFESVRQFNMMFTTHIGPAIDEKSKAYLRPETAQIIFTQFKNIIDTARVSLPFGVAQVGKSFRNEISPRNFLFRLRELEQAEIEYFIHPDKYNDCPYISEVENDSIVLFSEEMQEKKKPAQEIIISKALKEKIFKSPWHAYFVAIGHRWFTSLGVKKEHLRARQHVSTEKAHYAKDCWDLEYEFPFGFKELWGVADRGDYDLSAHSKHSKKDLSMFDEASKTKVVPHVVAEPALGIDRSFLVFLFDALEYDATRQNNILRLHPKLAPIKVAFFPLMKKDGLSEKTYGLYKHHRLHMHCAYDEAGSIGKRYARMDELGTPYCVTIDYQTLEDDTVTIRDRDSAMQKRVPIAKIEQMLQGLLSGTVKFSSL